MKPDEGIKTQTKARVGRGIAAGKGKTAGRGTKRSGRTELVVVKDLTLRVVSCHLVRRLPFKRGFTNIFGITYQEVNVDMLESRFDDGAVVNGDSLG